MSGPVELVTEGTKSLCRHCRSEMKQNARFCTACELFQNRFLRSKTATIYVSLLNALLATTVLSLTFILDKIVNMDRFSDSEVSVLKTTCDLDKASITVVNKGRRSAYLKDGYVTIGNAGENVSPSRLDLKLDRDKTEILDKRVTVIEAVFIDPTTKKPLSFEEVSSEFSQCNYSFNVSYQDFRSKQTSFLEPIPTCPCGLDLSDQQPAEISEGG